MSRSRRVTVADSYCAGGFYAFLDEVVARSGASGWTRVRTYNTPDGRCVHDITLTFRRVEAPDPVLEDVLGTGPFPDHPIP